MALDSVRAMHAVQGLLVRRAWHTGRNREAVISLQPTEIGRKGNANKARARPAMGGLKEA